MGSHSPVCWVKQHQISLDKWWHRIAPIDSECNLIAIPSPVLHRYTPEMAAGDVTQWHTTALSNGYSNSFAQQPETVASRIAAVSNRTLVR